MHALFSALISHLTSFTNFPAGKTLPCFRPFDAGARSCGFIGDRFLTGLRPQV